MFAQRVAVVFVALLPCVAVAQEIPWQAERVMLRRDGVRAGRPVAGYLVRQGKELLADSLYTVLRADGGLLELGDNCGWVARVDVVRLRDAAAYFTARIKEEPTAAKWYGRRAVATMAHKYGTGLTIPLDTPGQAARPSDLPLDDLRQAVRLDPDNAERRAGLAAAYMVCGQLDTAAEECEAIIRLAPKDAESYVGRGCLRVARNDVKGALADFEKAVELDPSSLGARDALGMAYHAAGQMEKVKASLRRLAEMPATTSSDHKRRANARSITGDMDGMLADLAEVVRLDPADVETRRQRGGILRERGEYRAALADFRWIARLRPGDPDAVRREAFLLATCQDEALRDGRRAVELAKRAHAQGGGDPDIYTLGTLAAAHAEVGDFASAVAAQKRAIQSLEGKPNYYDEIGGFQWWLKQYEREAPRRE